MYLKMTNKMVQVYLCVRKNNGGFVNSMLTDALHQNWLSANIFAKVNGQNLHSVDE